MTGEIVLVARVVGTVVSWPLVAATAFLAVVVRQVVDAYRVAWTALDAVVPPSQAQQRDAVRAEHREQDREEAALRRHRRQVVGALDETPTET